MRGKCPQCATPWSAPLGANFECNNCGFTSEGLAPPMATESTMDWDAPPPTLAPTSSREGPGRNPAVVFGVNLALPGVGTLLAGRTKAGGWQVGMAGVGLVLSFLVLPLVLVAVAWVWAFFTSLEILGATHPSGRGETRLPAAPDSIKLARHNP